MADISRRDFIKAGVAGAALITYVTPTIETFMMANAWADEKEYKDDNKIEWWEQDTEGGRHPSRKMKWWRKKEEKEEKKGEWQSD